MARLNIDDEVWMDPRVQMLQRALGENEALGQLLRFWKIAQLYWGKETLVPTDVFRFHNFSEELITFGLAEITPNGIYAKGSEAKFDWYLEKIRSGKRGGLKKAENAFNKNKTLLLANPGEAVANPSESYPLTLVPAPAPVPDIVPTPVIDNKNRVERKNPVLPIESVLLEDSTSEIVLKIKQSVLDAWASVYSDHEWVKQEIRKAIAWMAVNPDRKPKSRYAQFMNTWLDRGWEKHRKSLPSNQATEAFDIGKILERLHK